MSRPDDCEMPTIQRCDRTNAKSFGKRYDGRIDGSQRQVVVPRYQLGNPHPIARDQRLRKKVP